MSYYDDSSLFVAPNGYKTSVLFAQKPMDANGQLAFTRSNDTATRVGPDGLIEKVRTNLLLQSNSFDTTWANNNTTETGGQSDKDGGSTAWLIDSSSAFGSVNQGFSAVSGVFTFSVYAKAGTNNWMLLRMLGSTSARAWFNLSSGVLGTIDGPAIASKIEPVGGGYYKCSISGNMTSFGQVLIYPTNADTVVGAVGNIYIQNAQLEQGSIATDYIPTTTTAVSVGPVANVPRLDYLNSSCPRLLLEPQRTNVLQQSEYLSSSYFTKNGTSVSTNQTVSPEGVQNASELTEDTSTGTHEITRSITNVVSTSYSISVFAKANTRNWIRLSSADGGFVYFNLSTGEKGTETNATGKIVPFSNGWYRCEITFTASGTNGSATIRIAESDGVISYTGESKSVYLYGFQYETGSYSTSYIPSYGAASTRGADACSKTGISSLIGQSEGTLFLDFIYKPVFDTTQTSYRASISDGTYGGRVSILAENSNTLSVVITGVSLTGSTFPIVDGQRYKVAIGYGATTDVYINGAKVYSYSSGTPTGTYTRFQFSDAVGLASRAFAGPINQALLFKTCLSNSELASLTTL
jgi:hypothetical protein